MKKIRKIVSIVLSLLMIASVVVAVPSVVNASGITTDQIKSVLNKYGYSTGKYWTMYDKATTDPKGDATCGATKQNINSDLYASNSPANWDSQGYKSYNFNGAWQCHGFALYVMSKVTGTTVSSSGGKNWEKITSKPSSLQVGDIIRAGGHTAIVLTNSNNNYTFAECWGGVNSKINIGGGFNPASNTNYHQLSQIVSHSYEYVLRYKGGHTHNFYYAGAESAHPHYKIYKCSCGAKEVRKNETINDSSCKICNPTQCVSDGEYHIVSALDNSLGLNVANNSTESGANVQLWNNMDEGNVSSLVTVKHIGSGYYTMTFRNSGKNLDVAGGSKTSGTNVQQYTSNSTDSQKWIIAPTGDGYFYIVTKLHKNLFLDAYNASATPGTNVWICTGNATKAQKWKFIASGVSYGQTIADGEYTIASAKNNYYGLNLYGGETTDGTNIHLWNNMGFNHPNTIVKVKYLGNGLYSIVFKKSDKALEVKGGSNISGTNVQQWSSNGSNAQKWIIRSAGNGSYYVISKGSGLALDATGGTMANGTNVQAHLLNYSDAQKWKFNLCRDKIVYNPNEGRLYNDNINAVFIDGINSGREESKIIVYTGAYGSKTTTNQYGDEFAFDSKGKKVGKRVYGNTEGLAIPSGGFVISKHATNSYALHTVAGNAEYAYFDYNRGTVFFYNNEHDYLADTKTVAKGEAYGSLITPEREGCVFDGWYTSAEGGTKITEKSIYNGVNTLYAHWSTIDGTNPDAEPVTEKTTDSPSTEPVTDKPSETTDIQDPTDSTSEPSETIPQTPETTAVEPDENQNTTDKPTEPDVTQPVTEKPTDEKQTIEPVADGYKRYMFLPSIDFENEGYNYRVMICDQNGEYKFYNLVATGIKFGEAMLYAVDIPEETIPEIIQYMIFDGDDLISNVVEYASEKIKFDGKIVKFDGSIIDESDSDEPVPDKPIVKAKKTNPVKISVKAKTVKLKKLKKKAQNIKAITVSQAQGKVTYKLKSVPAKLKKFAKINFKGVITLKKWKKAKKGTYKITVQISVKGNSKYKPKTVNKTVKIKVK